MIHKAKFKEYKNTYFGETKVFECSLLSLNERELVISYSPKKKMKFIGLEFEESSISFGYYWEDRNYNVYHWKDNMGKTLLFYFNISRDTKIEQERVSWLDLIVDIAIKKNEIQILDEEEVPQGMAIEDRRIIERSKKEIIANSNSILDSLERSSSSLFAKYFRQG